MTQFERQLDEKIEEIDEVRTRITQVAELFERKPITQKYSFEVLCDFIIDKAKRLFAKYDQASKDRKVIQEENRYYYKRKVEAMEQEQNSLREAQQFAERVTQYIVPRMQELIETPVAD